MSPDAKGCMDRNECLDLPCLNGATCINLEPRMRYRCICPDGFWGENCELVQEGQTLKLSMGALAAILVCLLIILSEQSIKIVFFCFEDILFLLIFFRSFFFSKENYLRSNFLINIYLFGIVEKKCFLENWCYQNQFSLSFQF